MAVKKFWCEPGRRRFAADPLLRNQWLCARAHGSKRPQKGYLRKRRPKPHTTWHLDEVNLKISKEGVSPLGLRHGAPFSGATYLRDRQRNIDPMVLPGGPAVPERRHVWPGSAMKGVGQTFVESGDRRRANANGLGARSDESSVLKSIESGNLSLK
jgi:hypothetical protein